MREQWTPGLSLAIVGILAASLATSGGFCEAAGGVSNARWRSLRLAVEDLIDTFEDRYPAGGEYLRRLETLKQTHDELIASGRSGEPAAELSRRFRELKTEALLANPLLDFDRLLLIKRRPFKGGKPGDPNRSYGWEMGFPRSSTGHSSLRANEYDNEIAVLSPVAPGGKLTTVYKPARQKLVTDVDLHSGAEKMIFSMRGKNGRWQIFEIGVDGRSLRQLSLGGQGDVDSYDPCYLPDGRIVYCGSGCFQGVPCNKSDVAVLYRMHADGTHVRQLCFEQDHDFNPTMLPGGRVLYLRWEYSDIPHSNSRIMFSMNPDGTSQLPYYGSNSYWPNGIFGAKPIPDHPGKFAGIVAGHHGSHRAGELVLFDAGKGRHEAEGVIQRIPGHGQEVEPLVRDQLTAASWPKFIHPYPLSDKYLLVTCKRDGSSPWDVCLVDVFDNIVPVFHVDGYGLFEPVPLRKTPAPPVIPERIDPAHEDALVYIADVYRGDGLRGVPRGSVKKLRLFSYHFAYQGMGGLLGVVGLDGPWDIKRVLGTVPVRPDGSALFRIPANTPISLQPLDEQGKALQLMRSWLVGMPGEVVSCVGCHDAQRAAPAPPNTLAARLEPSEIVPWYGPPRNFSYKREVQPVVDEYCVACHNGQPDAGGREAVDLRGTELTGDYKSHIAGNGGGAGGRYFSAGYLELSRYVRRGGIESDIHVLRPAEYHADTTQLVQMLSKGHYGVRLDNEAWDRLITWIDLNTPYHGTWTEVGWNPGQQRRRRQELRKKYAGVDEDPESLQDVDSPRVETVVRQPVPPKETAAVSCPGWPFDAAEAKRRQAAAAPATRRTVDLGGGQTLALVLIPAGEFVMGDPGGDFDERPPARVKIGRSFWMGACELTNRQYALFDPSHDSRFESKNGYQFGVTGFALDRPNQPVVRVSWQRAMAFCDWLSKSSGRKFTLPSEAQWEYACRAGTATATWYGDVDHDFSRHANLADAALRKFASDPYAIEKPLKTYTRYDDWIPKDNRYDDGGLVTVEVGKYQPNAWGLYDLHGNAAEWTRTAYRPFPYDAGDGRNAADRMGRKVARGGSWRDRPRRCRSAFRLGYAYWQRVYNVGFRVVCEDLP